MKSKALLIKGYQSVVDNGRGHNITLDLPQNQNGEDLGATALELAVMSFSGCVSTIFKLVADKMRITISKLEVDMDAEKGDETIEKVDFTVNVEAEADEEKLKKCLDVTVNTCPVGLLFKKAGVKINYSLIKL